ncbi:MAG TPA: hypothetical protein PKE40_01095 [Arachnia sp.]|nr:hypothetical protein [Arachnia sp.]HMT84923.1 hypothetical protein [Arachnia sp.]
MLDDRGLKPVNPKIGGLRQPVAPRRRGWLRWVLVALLVPALLLPLVLWLEGREPRELSQAHLVGERSPLPLGVVVLLDVSGSFYDYADMRQEALDEVMAWTPSNLRDDDMLTVIAFAERAGVILPATPVAELAGASLLSSGDLGSSETNLRPGLEAAAREMPDDLVTTLVVVTDTEVGDLSPGALDEVLRELKVDAVSAIVPDGASVSADWREHVGWSEIVRADPSDAGEVALAVGRSLAHATGQTLEK